MNENKKEDILKLNDKQTDFYNKSNSERPFNFIMKIWRTLRRRMYFLMNNSGIWEDVFSLQKEWIGDLSDKKVLDFGCFDGNALSFYLATNSSSYLGIDLSGEAMDRLAKSLADRGIEGARVQCVDVLSDDFTESGFDIIYAQGVLHHFNPIDVLLPILQAKLARDGKIVSLDPLQTSLLTRSVRAIYHPFRSDKEWEWPFTRQTFGVLRKYFKISKVQGVIGRAKWAIPVAFLHRGLGVKIAKKLHSKDMACAQSEDRNLWQCMQMAMCLELPDQKG